MNKIAIPYYNKPRMMLFLLTALIPLLIIRKLLIMVVSTLPVFWLISIVAFIAIIALWYRLAYMMPFVKCTAYTWVQEGKTCLALKEGGEVQILDSVEEIFLSEAGQLMALWGCKSTMLEIKNRGKKTVLLSPPIDKFTAIEDTIMYGMFMHLLGKNPHLVQEKTIKGESIPYWYVLPKQ